MWAASLVGEERVVLVNRRLMAVEGDTDIIRNVLFGDISQVPPSMVCSQRSYIFLLYFAWVNQRCCPFCIESTGQFCISHVPSHTVKSLKSDGYPELPIVAEWCILHCEIRRKMQKMSGCCELT